MPRPSGILLDFLAPRLFRNTTISRGAWKSGDPITGATRPSSGAALLKEVEVNLEATEQVYESTERGREREQYEGESLAGPSRLRGMTEGLGIERYSEGLRAKRKTWLSPRPLNEGLRELAGACRTTGRSRLDRKEDSNVASLTDMESPDHLSAASIARIGHPSRRPSREDRPSDRSLSSHLRQPKPPDPTHLLHSYPLTRTSGDLLLRYAERLGDRRSEREIRDKMGRMRLAPVRYMDPRQRGRRRLLYPKQDSQDRGLPKDLGGEEILENGTLKRVRPPLSPELRELRARSNIWARRMWPPLPDLPTFRDPTPQGFLRYQHHLLIFASSPPPFVEALSALAIVKGVKDRHLRELLHLFLVYTPFRPEHTDDTSNNPDLLPEFYSNSAFSFSTPPLSLHPIVVPFLMAHPQILPTRQTLHLLVRCILSASSSSLSASLKWVHVRSLLAFFRIKWNIRPGCETWRHLMKFALFDEDRQSGRMIWDGWWDARERYMRGSIGDKMERRSLYTGPSTLDGQDVGRDGGIKDDPDGAGVEDWQQDELEEGEVLFRFRHLGTHLSRWIRVVKQLEDRGWVKRRLQGQSQTRPPSKAGWIWRDEGEET